MRLYPMKFRPAYLLLLLFAFSCGRGNPALRSAERVIEDHPDSALYILDGVSRVDLASEREKAEYDFLSAEAFYRTYYFLDDASEAALERACLYFEANGPAVERMRAWELMGTIQTAVGRYGSGMVSFRKAGAVARDIERSRSRLGMLALLVAAISGPGRSRRSVSSRKSRRRTSATCPPRRTCSPSFPPSRRTGRAWAESTRWTACASSTMSLREPPTSSRASSAR